MFDTDALVANRQRRAGSIAACLEPNIHTLLDSIMVWRRKTEAELAEYIEQERVITNPIWGRF
jgi:hypothetical protein